MQTSSRNRGVVRNLEVALTLLIGLSCFRLEAQTNRPASEPKKRVDFQGDVEEVFTRRGCNDSHCHGGVKGRGGLKLSLNALIPRDDYEWIVKGGTFQVLSPDSAGPRKPRIDLAQPDKSLLLLKPTFTIPHAGGERFKVGSDDYQTLLTWIREGAPFGDEGAAKIERVDVSPGYIFLATGEKQQLRITGQVSDGGQQDLTRRVRYETSNSDVATVTDDGLVTAVGSGETVILVRSPGQVAYARAGVFTHRLATYPPVPERNFIDHYVFAKLRKMNVVPSELASDSEFLRRVCLDVTGTLPPPDRVREFLASPDPQKREKLVEVLLNSPEYVDYWTLRFSDLFRVGRGDGSEIKLPWEWVRRSIATNKPYNLMARERITAEGFNGPSRYFVTYGETPLPEKKMAEQFRLFWGIRLDCAQCHNHPFENWTQNQFWGLAAFFSKVTQTNGNGTIIYDDHDGQEKQWGVDGKTDLNFVKAVNPRTRKEVQPAFMDGSILPEQQRSDPRVQLATWMIAQDNFAQAAVNRMWGYFFGRGIVNPIDDFRSTNPPTHPDLLAALGRDFRDHGYDVKYLIRLIVNSRTYQLSSIPNETNGQDETNYSHALPRPLDAEVLLDGVTSVTGVPADFVESIEGGQNGIAPPGTRAIQLEYPAMYKSRFLEVFGRPFRDTLPDRKDNPSLAEGLDMLVGSTYTKSLTGEGSRLDRLLKSGRSDRDIVDELFLAAFARTPTEKEFAGVEALASRRPREAAMKTLVWALISSREFAYNH